MLKLGLDLSLSSLRPMGAWSPDDEASLEAWYQNKVGIGLNGTDVAIWDDSSSNTYGMVQTTATEQPAYNASTGALTFVNADTNNLQSVSQLSLSGVFTIGIRLYPTSFSNVVIASNTTDNEFIKITAADQIRLKTDAAVADITLDEGEFGDDYIVFTRNDSNLVTLWHNGAEQTDTETRTGTVDIDCIGVRKTDANAYAGTIKEIQIYSSTNATLTANINDRLSTL